MKNIKLSIFSITLALSFSCTEFLDIVPEDSITLDGYFKTEEQCLQATAPLYGFVWFNYNDKAKFAIGDVYSGNMYTNSEEHINFHNYTVAQNNVRMFEAWSACYAVVAHANNVINNLPPVAGENGVDSEVINECIAEAKFMRGTAYYYLVQLFGAVPIIENSTEVAKNYYVNRIIEEDVFHFIIKDLQWAEMYSPTLRTGSEEGRITRWAAKALLAKVFLSMKQFATAQELLAEIIESGQYSLLENYGDLFYRSDSDYNEESIFAWGWVANQNWGSQNTHQAYFAVTGEITTVGDGWGTVKPSIDFLNAIENDDLRIQHILMQDGDYYPELLSASGGFTYDSDTYFSDTRSGIKKYVVGSPEDDNVGFMSTGINTDVLRFADVLLMYAEAVLGNNNSSADLNALNYLNQIRRRANLPVLASFSREELLYERRIEFAFEGQYLFDLVRILGEQGAIDYLSNVERGSYSGDNVVSQKFTCTKVKFGIPTSEVDQNPKLKEDPVEYNWSKSEYQE